MPFDHLLLPLNQQSGYLAKLPRSLDVLSELLVGGHRFLQHLRQLRTFHTARIIHAGSFLRAIGGQFIEPNR
jgi:hypothetical protein